MKRTETTDNLLEKIADESGLAVIVVDENSSRAKANNNSICEILFASEEFAPACTEDCGRAFARAKSAGDAVAYQCHAGLDCVAVPLKTEKPLVAIVGRAFTKAENYRRATERAITGDWNKFPPTRFFGNVLLTGSMKVLERAANEAVEAGDRLLEGGHGKKREKGTNEPQIGGEVPKTKEEQRAPNDEQLSKLIEDFHRRQAPPTPETEKAAKKSKAPKKTEEAEEAAAWRSLFGSLFDLDYREACLSILKFLSQSFALSSLAWLERRDERFESLLATGALEGQQFRINLPANDKLLFDALEKEISLDLRERGGGAAKEPRTISLFPVAVGKQVQSALVAADELTEDLKRRIARFCKTVAAPLEILRLREEVSRRAWLAEAVEKFNASLHNLDTDDFWAHLTRVSAELMQAERSSLLVFDEKNDSLVVKAAIGATADRITGKSERIGERVARIVLNNGRPVVVHDLARLGFPKAPADWKYKSNSFISYPFTIGSRRVGILNITDRADGTPYEEKDLELLETIAPQVALLLERADLKSRAGALEQLSVTDGLTGLLNRRYLEERLAEEIKRSNRYGYPMSFMMIDVDHFKSYNDAFGHPAGDQVLKMVAKCFRETLRGADVAARYGGEEFSILLPQTTSSEAETIAERVREHIAATEFPHRAVTISIGIASCCLDLNSAPELLGAADRALYGAKRKGRNAIQVYEKLKIESEKLNRRDADTPRI
jgi:diguanylate cyclase (GGDEF)-like protein